MKQTGDALVKFSDNPPIRVQFPYIDNVELEDKIDEWRENPEIGPAPDFDFFVEKGDALYAKGAVDLEPKPLDYNRVIHILPEKLRQKDNIFLNRDFKKLCSQLAREPFGWNTKFLKRVYKSVQTFDTIETTLCMYGILKNTSEKATPAYELSCDLKGIGYAFERFGMPNFEKLNNHQIMMEFGDAIGFGESDGFIDDSDRQFVFKETISQRVLNNRNVSQEKKESFIYDILKLIILNLQNSSTEGAELTYNLDKYPDPTPEEEDEESTEDSDDGNDRVGNMPTLSQKEKDDVAPQSDEPDDEEEEVHIPTMESILSNAKKSAVSAKSVIAIAQLALIDIETVGAVDVDSILEITEGDRELCDRVLEYLVDNGEIVEDDINGGYRYIAGDESLIYDELDEESEEVELPEEYRIKEEESSEPPTSSPEASEEEPEEEPSTPDSRSDEEEEKQEEEAIAPVKEIIEKKPEPKQEAPKVPQSILDDFDAIVE